MINAKNAMQLLLRTINSFSELASRMLCKPSTFSIHLHEVGMVIILRKVMVRTAVLVSVI